MIKLWRQEIIIHECEAGVVASSILLSHTARLVTWQPRLARDTSLDKLVYWYSIHVCGSCHGQVLCGGGGHPVELKDFFGASVDSCGHGLLHCKSCCKRCELVLMTCCCLHSTIHNALDPRTLHKLQRVRWWLAPLKMQELPSSPQSFIIQFDWL